MYATRRNKIITLLLFLFLSTNLNGQDRAFIISGYLSAGIGKEITQYRVFKQGSATLTNQTTSHGLYGGAGLTVIKTLPKLTWNIGGELAFISKGYFASMDTVYSSGSFAGTSFKRTDLNYLETTVFIEKSIQLKNPEYKFLFAPGLYYGFSVQGIIGSGLQAKGNDLGSSVSVGIQRKRSYLKADFKSGFINIRNDINSKFKNQILNFKLGTRFTGKRKRN